MDSKKILEKLLKIASNQQKIITKLAQQQLPPQHLAPRHVVKENISVAIRHKLGPHASQIASIGISQSELQGGAAFKVMYSSQQNIANPKALEDKIYEAVVALQKEGLPGMPMGNFYIERV
jgi:hypothetical protein